jgi:hypothetical protein
MAGKIWIAFFVFVAVLLLWRSIVWPLWGSCIKVRMTGYFLDAENIFQKIIFWIMIAALLYILGMGFLWFAEPFKKLFWG